MIILTYLDDCTIIGPNMKDVNRFVESMKRRKDNFTLTDQGNISKFLGIQIIQLDDKKFQVSQPFLVDQILSFSKN